MHSIDTVATPLRKRKAGVSRKKRPYSFYFAFGLLALGAVIGGFLTTYFQPIIARRIDIPWVVHVHGFFAFAWVVLFLLQTIAVKSGNFQLHRRMGFAALAAALGILFTLIPVGLFQVRRDLALGLGDFAISIIVGVITTGIMFAILVAFGFRFRRKPKIHKRLMLLATILIIWPAWFRFRHYFPAVPRPDIWFAVVLADSLIIVAWVVEWLRYKKIHPVLLFGGLGIMVEHALEVTFFDSGPWRIVAKAIYGLF